MKCVVCGLENPRGNRWQTCSVHCSMIKAKMYVRKNSRQANCAHCGKLFTKPWPKTRFCSPECNCKDRNKKRRSNLKSDLENLTEFRKKLKQMHCEVANREPNKKTHADRLKYLEQYYERQEGILMEYTGKDRGKASMLPCRIADEILARVG